MKIVERGPKTIRYHFSAPASDVQIAEWIEAQHNFSSSIRLVIKDYIAKHGMIDATCLPMMTDDAAAVKYEQAYKKPADTSQSVEQVNSVPNTPVTEIKTEPIIEQKSEPIATSQPAVEQTSSTYAMDDMLADLMK